MSNTNSSLLLLNYRNWAVSAIILGVFFIVSGLPMYLQGPTGYLTLEQNFMSYGKLADMKAILTILALLTSVSFVLGGVLVLRENEIGRDILRYGCMSAGLVTALYYGLTILVIQSNPFRTSLFNNLGSNGNLQGMANQHLVSVGTAVLITMLTIVSIVEITYCVLLYRKMSAKFTVVEAIQ